MAGQKEYEVEMQFSSGLVSYPVRTKTGEEFVDGEQPVYGSVTDMSSIAASRTSMQPPSKAPSMLNIGDEGSEFVMGQSNIKLTVEPPKRKVSITIVLEDTRSISNNAFYNFCLITYAFDKFNPLFYVMVIS